MQAVIVNLIAAPRLRLLLLLQLFLSAVPFFELALQLPALLLLALDRLLLFYEVEGTSADENHCESEHQQLLIRQGVVVCILLVAFVGHFQIIKTPTKILY